MTRKLLIAGGILAVILIVAVKFLGSNLDAIVKKAITVGPEMTGVSVDVDKVGISLADGRGEIGGLVIGNPRGYKGPHAFKLGSIALALDKTADTAGVVVIKELTIDGLTSSTTRARTAATSRPSSATSTSTARPTPETRRRTRRPRATRRQALHHRIAADPQRQDTAYGQGHRDGPAAGPVCATSARAREA